MSDIKIGQIIAGPAQRDAIHMAVAPVVAGQPLEPGQHVGLVEGKAISIVTVGRVAMAVVPIGIVDPFLPRGPVEPGEMFWLFLYHGSIKGLRHEWSHPAFENAKSGEKAESEAWLRAYAVALKPYEKDPEEAYQQLIEGLKNREVSAYGRDLSSIGDLDDVDELKTHAERLLGIIIRWDGFEFRCGC